MARIRHIALLTKDTEKLAEFYRASFGLKEVARSGEGSSEHGRAIYLSDGHINLAILPARNRREGIYHFGMEVEDVKGATQTALAAGATGGTAELPRDGRFAETFVLDPVGTRVDLSQGWKV
jgi:catechol 2,3-dioxygenase-like lactoylglutathione lyase family enzyme